VNEGLVIRTAERLASCPGLDAVVLGGSHASGAADMESDIDLGLYYESEDPLDLETLRQLVSEIDDHGRGEAVTDFGAWGPWVNGGAWIEVEGQRVDLIYRDLDRVGAAIDDCRAGRIGTHFQVGHPAGFSPQIYAAEIYLCRALKDPRGTIGELKGLTDPYPSALRRAPIAGLWEARFSLDTATKSALRGDVYHVAGSAFRAVACMTQALFGLNERYWINEKLAISLADALPLHPEDFAHRVEMNLGGLGIEPEALRRSLRALGELLDDTASLCEDDESSG
jgi:hypothetical protein